MNARTDLDRVLTTWLVADAPRTPPEDLLSPVFAVTSASRPMPAWRALLSVAPMRTQSTVLVGSPTLRLARVVVALVLLAGLIVAVAIAGSRPTPQVRGDVMVYSVLVGAWPPGEVLYVKRTDGLERPLTRAVGRHAWVEDISPDGRQVAVQQWTLTGPLASELRIVDIATRDEWGPGDVYWCGFEAAWSPTGDRLAYTVAPCETTAPVPSGASVDAGVFIVDVARRQTTRITAAEQLSLTQARDGDLALLGWSPDGDWLLVSAGRESYRLFRVAVSGGEAHAIDIAEEHTLVQAGWSPDGTQLVLSVWDTDYRPRVEVAAADGSGRRVVADDAQQPVWSPDGDRILFARDVSPSEVSERFEFWVMAPDGRDQRKIASGRYSRGWELTRPRWTPDGTRIYWSDSDGTFTIRPDGTQLTKLDLPAGIRMDWWSGGL